MTEKMDYRMWTSQFVGCLNEMDGRSCAETEAKQLYDLGYNPVDAAIHLSELEELDNDYDDLVALDKEEVETLPQQQPPRVWQENDVKPDKNGTLARKRFTITITIDVKEE